MFGNLRAGSSLYIISKNLDNPSFAIGKLVSDPTVRQVMLQPQGQPAYNLIPQMAQVLDLTVQVGDDTKTFTGVNPSLMTINTGENGYIVSTDKAAFDNELAAYGAKAQHELNLTPYYQKVVELCKHTRLSLNPELQKAAERDNEIAEMRKKMDMMFGRIGELTTLLKGGQAEQKGVDNE